MPPITKGTGITALTLDGGGVGVLSELTVLRELLHRIKSENSLLEVPYACDCFDIMAGSGIGAVLIILLGKLRLGIDATIEYYLRLEREVFTKKKLFSTGSVFSATALERVMGEIVARHCGRPDARMIEDEGQTVRCKVMVVARTADAIRAGLPTCIRSYRVSANQGPDCTIIEAVRATTAMPGMFKRATIYEQGVPIAYIGGALECNNPTDHLLSDLSAVFPDRGVASIVSIGSGQLHSASIPESRMYDTFLPSKLIPAVRAIATDCEKTHQNLARRFEEAKGAYFRFNTEHGMQDMDQSDRAKLPEVQAHTRNYLLDPLVSARMDQAAKATIERVGILKNSQGNIRLLNQPSSTIRRYPPPSSDFTGREDILEMMQRYFFSHLSSSRRIFVLHGLGGAGKTQLALKFVQLHKKRFWDIFYIDATTHNTISTGLVQIAKAAQVGETKEDGLAWLVSQEQSWLLLFNNADDPELNLSLYFPACAHGDVLITTRNKQMIVHTRGTGSHCRVSEMLPDDAKELLLKIYGSDEDEDPGEAVTTLVERLGLFALAIVQAAAYMRATQCKATDYLIYLQSSREQLLRARLVNQTDAYGLSVYATWEISYKKINSRAAQLLHILSFMHHEGIEERFFEISSAVTSYKPEIPLSEEQGATKDAIFEFLSLFRTASHGWNLLAFRNLTEDLSAFSLLDYNPRTRTHSMHPLVQEWCRSTAPNAMAMRECAAWVLALCVNSRFGLEDYAFRRRLLPHLLALDTNTTQMVPELAQKLCLVYDEAGLTKEDEALSKIALQGSRDMFGNEHSTTLTCMHNLASAFRRQGKSEEAMTLLTEVIESSKRVLGDEHPDTLTSMHSLAMTYRAQERWKESEAMFLDVIETERRVGGIEDSRTLKSMGVLASTYAEQGRLLEAELLYDEVLEKMSKVLGKEHPHTLTAMHNLATTYGGQGKLVEAELLMKETVALRTKVLGELHTHTLNSVRILEAIHQRVRLELSPSLLPT